MESLNKRIIFAVTNDLKYDQRMQRICRSLAEVGFEVELVGRVHSYSLSINEEPYKQTRLRCWFNKGKLFYVEFNIRLFVYLLFCRFDAVCAIDLDTIVPCYFAGKIHRAKLFYDAHEYFTEVPEVVNRPFTQKIWQSVERVFAPRYDVCYTVSKSIAELFSVQYHKHFEVIRNVPLLLDLEDSKPSSSPDKIILYQGALNDGRGLETMIETMQFLDYKFVLCGEGDMSDSLRALATKLNVTDKVQFLGFIEPKRLKTITRTAWIGYNLAENKGLSYYYSLNNKFFDYIHAEIPQLCTNFPEPKRINDEFKIAHLVEDLTADAILKAIRHLEHETYYNTLKQNCTPCKLQLNWQEEQKTLIALYEHQLR